jgi:hypothetical protein
LNFPFCDLIAAALGYERLGDLSKLLIGGIIGFLVGIFARWPLEKLSERRALVKDMGRSLHCSCAGRNKSATGCSLASWDASEGWRGEAQWI